MNEKRDENDFLRGDSLTVFITLFSLLDSIRFFFILFFCVQMWLVTSAVCIYR